MQATTDVKHDLWEKIKHVRVGMLTTVASGNRLLSRPMTNQKVDEEGLLWFFASDHAVVSENIQANPQVNVSFAAPDDSLWVSVSGHAVITKDKEKIHALWNPMVQAWFPGGPDDPQVALIQVKMDYAEYWDSDKSKMTQMFEMAKAAVTGHPPTGMSDHKKIDL